MIKNKKIRNYLFAFMLPFIICLTIFYFKDVFFNIEEIYVSDLRMQHLVFLNYLKGIILGDFSIFYSFSAGMGSSMLATIIFYCISPVNFLLLLIGDIRYAILFIYIVKVSLSGLTMFMLLNSKSNRDDFVTILFSTCYALSCFVINYFFCVFWFDSLYFAPLVMMGIDKIIKTEKINLLYIFSLSLAIMCNIQMGFGLCIYSVIYFIYSYNINYDIKRDFKKFKQLGLVFVISSLCAGAISSWALLGFISEYKNISAAREMSVGDSNFASNLGLVLKNLFTVGNLKGDYYNNFEPFIYCGLIVSFFSILYFFNSNIDKKKKSSALCVILVFLISFSIRFINLFWHLSSPVLLNFRYSIYLGLFLTMLAYECYLKTDKLTKQNIIVLSVALLIGFFMFVGYSYEIYIIWSFVFLILIFTLILLAKNKGKKFEILLFILVIVEMFFNGYLSIYTASQLPYGKYVSCDSIKELASLNDFDDSYRVMYNYSYEDFSNDTLLLNKNSSLRYFSSVINGDLIKFFNKNISTVGNNNYRISAFDSPLLLSLMGNKYFYLTEEFNNSIYRKVDSYKFSDYNYIIGSDDVTDVYLYENPYALSLGYVIESDFSYEEGMDLVDYQNSIIKSFTGNDSDVLIRLDYNIIPDSEDCMNSQYYSCETYEIFNNTNNVLTYVHASFDMYRVLNNSAKIYLDVNNPMLISTIDKEVYLNLHYSGDLAVEDFAVVTYDESNLISNLSSLQENMMSDIKFNKNTLTGKINSSKSGILFLSIGYDKNFEIYVDGEEVEYYSLLDGAFIGLDIENGEHDIELRYVDKNFKWYIICSLLSIIITIILYYFINKLITKRKNLEENLNKNLKMNKGKKKKDKNKKKNK